MKQMNKQKYMEWLEKFTDIYYEFTDQEDSLYQLEDYQLTTTDKENIKNISTLFGMLATYSKDHSLPFSKTDYTTAYLIKYHNLYYRVGLCVGTGSYCFIERTEDIKKQTIISFTDFENDLSTKESEKSNNYSIKDNLRKVLRKND